MVLQCQDVVASYFLSQIHLIIPYFHLKTHLIPPPAGKNGLSRLLEVKFINQIKSNHDVNSNGIPCCVVGVGSVVNRAAERVEGPRANFCSDCFNRVFDCSIRVYRSLGPISRVGPGQNAPVAPPPPPPPLSATLVVNSGSSLS